MRPSVVILGLILGTASSITFSLLGVTVMFLVLEPRYPRLEAEGGSLLANLAFFSVLTVFAALSFYGVLKQRRWRYAALLPLALTLAAIGRYYWPD
jgi:hypothetical protein